MKRSARATVFALMMPWLLAASTAMAAVSLVIQAYKFTSFEYPGAAVTDGRGINQNGDIVGQWQDSAHVTHGFLLSGGAYQSFDVPGALATYPQGINDDDVVVGFYTRWPQNGLRDTAGNLVCCESHGFVRLADGQFLTVDDPTINSAIPVAWLFGINNSGDMVGGYSEFELAPNPVSRGVHSFLFDGSAFTSIDFPSGPARIHVPVTYASGINDAGDVVGGYNDDSEYQTRHGFILRNGTYRTFDMPSAMPDSLTDLFDINNLGEIVGQSGECASNGFLYTPRWGFSCLPGRPVPKPKLMPSLPYGLNDAGQLVGAAGDGSDTAYLATPPPIPFR